MAHARASLFWALLLSLSVAPSLGRAAQDGDPKEKARIQSAIKTARTYIESGNRSGAERLLKNVVLVYPKHPATEEARTLLASLTDPGKGAPLPRSAPELLRALRNKGAQSRTLHVKYSLDCPAPDLPFSGSGEVKVNGNLQWKVVFDAKNKAGKTGRMEAWSDGRTVYSRGFQGESPRPATRPTLFVRQLREYGSTSFLPLFFGILYQKLDETENYASTTGGVKDLGTEKVGESVARKLEYSVTYPTGKVIRVVAWIDAKRMIPVKREIHFDGPAPLTETITSYTTGTAIPASEFAAPK